jgi:MFS family permease
LMLGLVEFLMRAPILGFSVAGGLLADRWSRHRLLMLTQALALLQAAVMAWLTLSGRMTIEWVLVLATFLGVINALDVPIRQSFVAELVPKDALPSAIGLNSTIFNAARIVGPSAAGAIVLLAGEGVCFLVNALSYLIVLGCLLTMRGMRVGSGRSEMSPLGYLRQGVSYAWHTPHVRALLALITVLSIAAMPHATLLPIFAGEILRVGPTGLGWLMAATGLGALVGAFGIARRQSLSGLGNLIAVAVILYGGGLLILAWSTVFSVSFVALVMIGFGMITSLAGTNTLLQSFAPDQLRGRIMSFYATVSLGFTTFGSLAGGVGATQLGAQMTVLIGGLVTILAALIFWRAIPRLRARARAQSLLPPEGKQMSIVNDH